MMENPIKEIYNSVPEFFEKVQDTALTILLKSGHHPGLLISYWKTSDTCYTVDHYIEESEFHEYLKTWENKDYALICVVEEEEQRYLMIEIWSNDRGIRKMIPFKIVDGKTVLDEHDKMVILHKHDLPAYKRIPRKGAK